MSTAGGCDEKTTFVFCICNFYIDLDLADAKDSASAIPGYF